MDRLDPQHENAQHGHSGHTPESITDPTISGNPTTEPAVVGDSTHHRALSGDPAADQPVHGDPLVGHGTSEGGYPSGGTAGFQAWNFRDEATATGAELVGYKVEATDGSIGKIDSDSREVGSSYLVVDTGPWIFGRKVMLPAGVIDRVDHDEERVYVDRTKDQIKAAPEFDETSHSDPAYRDRLGGYYGDTYGQGSTSYGSSGTAVPGQSQPAHGTTEYRDGVPQPGDPTVGRGESLTPGDTYGQPGSPIPPPRM
ncbi:hypothetical protein GCM10027605_17490 [Micromonospora zhanjiangensis]